MRPVVIALIIVFTLLANTRTFASEKFSSIVSLNYNNLQMDIADQSSNSGFSINPRFYFPIANPSTQVSVLFGGGLTYDMFLKSDKRLGMDSLLLVPSFGMEFTNIANFILTILFDYQYALFNNVTQNGVPNDDIHIKRNQKFGFDIFIGFEAAKSLFLGLNVGLHYQSIKLKKSGIETSNNGANSSVGLSLIYSL